MWVGGWVGGGMSCGAVTASLEQLHVNSFLTMCTTIYIQLHDPFYPPIRCRLFPYVGDPAVWGIMRGHVHGAHCLLPTIEAAVRRSMVPNAPVLKPWGPLK